MSSDANANSGAARLARSLRQALGSPRSTEAEGLLIGCDDQGREVRIPWPNVDGKLYLVPGARGTGKTVFLSRMQNEAIARGWGVLTIDAKGDPLLRSPCTLRWTYKGPTPWNPYGGSGSSPEISDKLLAGERWSESHYLRLGQRYIGAEVRTLREKGIEISLATIVTYLEPGKLLKLVEQDRDNKTLKSYLRNLTAEQEKGLAGVRDRLAVVSESEIGHWWEGGPDSINLWEATQRGERLHFLLDADGVPLLSAMINAALILDLNTLVSRRNEVLMNGGTLEHLFVVIDEFGALAADLSSIADRGRAAKITLVLATQDLYSHTAKPEGLRGGLLANFDAMISLRQQSPPSATLVAEVSGEEEIVNTSWNDRKDNRYAIEEATRVRAGQIMRLPNYHATVIVPSCPEDSSVTIARLINPAA